MTNQTTFAHAEFAAKKSTRRERFLARMECAFYRSGELERFGERGELQRLANLKFHPYFDGAGVVVWSASEKREEVMSTDSLVSLIAEKLTDYVENTRR